jgi:hypothetical protein
VPMNLFTAMEMASAVSCGFARDSTSGMRSTRIVFEDKQRQLIGPNGANGKI